MGSLDTVLGTLAAQPWGVRCQFTVQRDGNRATVHRGGMEVGVWEARDGSIEVAYEHALHEATRVRLNPAAAAAFVLDIIARERLTRVGVPGER